MSETEIINEEPNIPLTVPQSQEDKFFGQTTEINNEIPLNFIIYTISIFLFFIFSILIISISFYFSFIELKNDKYFSKLDFNWRCF